MKRTLLSFWFRILLIGCVRFKAVGQDPCGLNFHEIHTSNSAGQLIGQTAAYDSQRQVAVLFGGNNPLTGVFFKSDTWEWDGVVWTQRTSGTPPARSDAAMAYDCHRAVCVLFGGGTNVFEHQIPFNDIWEWDGNVWTMRQANDPAATNRPPPLDFPKMSYDSGRRRMVLIGSTERAGNQVNPVTRTWEWDGNSWSVRSSALPPRYQPAMAYDPLRRVTVVFGGTAYGGSALNDTWTWDGTNWTLVAVGGPLPRDEHAMAFDTRRGLMVMGGGSTGGVTSEANDAWEWNGQSWSEVHGLYPFTPRRRHQMWYGSGEEAVFVFGGTYSTQTPQGGFNHYVRDDLWAARGPGLWINFSYPGQEFGTFDYPYNTVAEGVEAATPGCVLNMMPGSTTETLTISKPATLRAYKGPVTIGQ